MIHAIQYLEDVRDALEASQALAWCATQVDYLGGRVLPPSDVTPRWRFQAFFGPQDDTTCWLPDGCRHVVIPPGQMRQLGISL